MALLTTAIGTDETYYIILGLYCAIIERIIT